MCLRSAILLPSPKRHTQCPLGLCEPCSVPQHTQGPDPRPPPPALQGSVALQATPASLPGLPRPGAPPPLALPRCPHLTFFNPRPHMQSTLPSSCHSSLRDLLQAFASSWFSQALTHHLSPLLGMSSPACSPHCSSGPLGSRHPACPAPTPQPSDRCVPRSALGAPVLKAQWEQGPPLRSQPSGAGPEAGTEC